jgi:hypothetical protein
MLPDTATIGQYKCSPICISESIQQVLNQNYTFVRIQFIKDSMSSIGTYKRSDGPAFDGSSRSGIDVADGYATDLRKLR